MTVILAIAGIQGPDLLTESIVTVIKRTAESLRFRTTEDLIEVADATKMKVQQSLKGRDLIEAIEVTKMKGL